MRKRQFHLLVQMIGRILAQYIQTAALQYVIDDGSKSKIILLIHNLIEIVDCHHDKRNWFPLTFKFVIWVKAFPQSPHTYGLSREFKRRLQKWHSILNNYEDTYRTCEWIRSWFRRLAACVKARKRKSMTIFRKM